MVKKLPVAHSRFIDEYACFQNNFWGLDVTEDEVFKEAKNLSTTKSSGFKGIKSKVLRMSLITLISPLTVLLNKCIYHGIFPNAWNIATVVLIPKKEILTMLKILGSK